MAHHHAALRSRLRRELVETGWCDLTGHSEFEWRGVRRLARSVGRNEGYRIRSQLHPPTGLQPWPRLLTVWDPAMQADRRELLKAALARGAFAE